MKRVTTSLVALFAGLIAVAMDGCQGETASTSPPVFIRGTATGLTGTTVLQNNGGDSRTVNANGPFTFSIPLTSGSPYAVTVQTQPANQTCTLTNSTGTAGSTDVTDIALTCVTNTQTLGGSVSGLSGSLGLRLNGGDILTITANGSFSFPAPVADVSTYSVTVQTQPADQTCTVANGSGVVGSTDVTDITITCTTNAFTTGGAISGLTGTILLQNNGGNTQSISTDGAFTFPTPINEGAPYAVTVKTQPASQTCSVTNGSGIMGSALVNNVAVVCATNAFSVGGTVSGLLGTVVLQNNGTDSLPIATNGAFTFATPLAQGGTYAVTISTQPATQTCSVTNDSGIMGSALVNNVAVVCATNIFSVGGTVFGLIGTVVLQNNSSDSLPIATNGAFTFAAPLAQGGTYAVTVSTQPATQTCSVTNGSGPVGGANVTNITVTCATNAYTVGGTVSGLIGTVVVQNNGSDSTPITSNGSFTFSTPVAEGGTYNVTVQIQPVTQTCNITNGSGSMGSSNVTNVSINCVTNSTTITASTSATIPVNGASSSITITNTGANTAFNVSATLPGGWLGVTQDSSNCAVLAPSNTCTLTFTSTTPYVAQGNISITGDNLSSSPTVAIAFSISGYLVFATQGVSPAATALVIGSADVSASNSWSLNFNNISGITDASVTPCNGTTDGSCDSGQIEAHYGTPYTSYAAGLCDQITSDNTGAVTVGTWYLPAICQLGGPGSACSAGIANIDTNLVQLGFSGLSGNYWSSTEYSSNPSFFVWYEYFAANGGSVTSLAGKNSSLGVRCARAMTY